MLLKPKWNPKNKFCVVRVHYSVDPDKNNPEWIARAKEGISEKSWQREYEISYETFSGKAVYEDFGEHLIAETSPKPGDYVYRGWDFGYHRPAVVFAGFNNDDQFCIYDEIMGEDEGIKKFASRVKRYSQANFPGAQWLDACFAPGTQVLTKNGYKPIEQVSSKDFVLTHKGNWKRVVKNIRNPNPGNLVAVSVAGSLANPIVCTSDHEFYSVKRGAKEHGSKYVQPGWNEAGSLSKNDQVFSPIVSAGQGVFADVYSEVTMRLIGCFLGVGYLVNKHEKSQIIFQYALDEKGEAIQEIIDAYCDQAGVIPTHSQHTTPNGVFVQKSNFTHEETWRLLSLLVRDSDLAKHGKKMVNKIVMCSDGMFSSLLYGLYLTNGWSETGRRDLVGFSNTSHELLKHIQLRLLMSGVRSSFVLKRSTQTDFIEGREADRENYYHLVVNGVSDVYSIFSRKYQILFDKSVRTVARVDDIEIESEWVYDLEVEDDHSYVVEGVLVHNCDPAGHQKSDKAEFTSIEVLRDLGIYPNSKPSAIDEGLEILRQRMVRRNDGLYGMIVSPKCKILIDGFKGGYRYPEHKDGMPEKEQPLKDGFYDHLQDCVRYIAVNYLELTNVNPNRGGLGNPIMDGGGKSNSIMSGVDSLGIGGWL